MYSFPNWTLTKVHVKILDALSVIDNAEVFSVRRYELLN